MGHSTFALFLFYLTFDEMVDELATQTVATVSQQAGRGCGTGCCANRGAGCGVGENQSNLARTIVACQEMIPTVCASTMQSSTMQNAACPRARSGRSSQSGRLARSFTLKRRIRKTTRSVADRGRVQSRSEIGHRRNLPETLSHRHRIPGLFMA